MCFHLMETRVLRSEMASVFGVFPDRAAPTLRSRTAPQLILTRSAASPATRMVMESVLPAPVRDLALSAAFQGRSSIGDGERHLTLPTSATSKMHSFFRNSPTPVLTSLTRY